MILLQAVRLLILSGIAFIVAFAAAPLWLKFVEHSRFGKQIRTSEDTPVFSSLHQKKVGTPTGAGVIIWGTVVFLAVTFFILSIFFDGFWQFFNFVNRAETYLPLAALVIAAVVGFADDWLGSMRVGGAKGGGLKVRHKLIGYTVLAAIGAWWFYSRLEWDVLSVPFAGNFIIGAWYIPIFMFIIIASAFSANETDGLDGLLGGVALFAFLALTVVAFTLDRYDLAAFCGVVTGALLAFIWFNIYPARFFMGDTGSMSLGITIGVVAMLTNTALFLPLFAFILVLESLSVIIQIASRKLRGKKVFLSTPLHHHFEALGWPESQVTMRFWIISAVATGLGLVFFFLSRL
jgi:phospho-N-acetylmuramoyl-pentapeptide-transferase